jgi:hypothetical protein
MSARQQSDALPSAMMTDSDINFGVDEMDPYSFDLSETMEYNAESNLTSQPFESFFDDPMISGNTPYAFPTSPEPADVKPFQPLIHNNNNQPASSNSNVPRESQSIASSSSPENSVQDSSSESSGRRKRKSSSLSSPYDAKVYNARHPNRNVRNAVIGPQQQSNPAYMSGMSYANVDADVDTIGQQMLNNFPAFSAQNSPGNEGGAQTIDPGKLDGSYVRSEQTYCLQHADIPQVE